ncbi:hypothetical protein PTSG_11934 [Salpingoeca rosetta]|uniref:Biogenesis of lysosome-related organelles complex 1 subunit 3 n=1 Tax=Salpingoeca rosetta (strain ATCC 50818 / BSB-021) TaxID=946362 RepID=F2U3I7_SALR5|nr:uncharacterized protein PTSG_11934 [Salpingoeca rosetta]EGD82181.1 hypothetical protein PTSG_11934 [Salpingoeca rosetta]|eukprot:XP_004996364.1 hypothetical protein PTSG_11934 [Salpingoeca rosetta]
MADEEARAAAVVVAGEDTESETETEEEEEQEQVDEVNEVRGDVQGAKKTTKQARQQSSSPSGVVQGEDSESDEEEDEGDDEEDKGDREEDEGARETDRQTTSDSAPAKKERVADSEAGKKAVAATESDSTCPAATGGVPQTEVTGASPVREAYLRKHTAQLRQHVTKLSTSLSSSVHSTITATSTKLTKAQNTTQDTITAVRSLSSQLSDINTQLDAYLLEPYLPAHCTVEVHHTTVLSADPVPSSLSTSSRVSRTTSAPITRHGSPPPPPQSSTSTSTSTSTGAVSGGHVTPAA